MGRRGNSIANYINYGVLNLTRSSALKLPPLTDLIKSIRLLIRRKYKVHSRYLWGRSGRRNGKWRNPLRKLHRGWMFVITWSGITVLSIEREGYFAVHEHFRSGHSWIVWSLTGVFPMFLFSHPPYSVPHSLSFFFFARCPSKNDCFSYVFAVLTLVHPWGFCSLHQSSILAFKSTSRSRLLALLRVSTSKKQPGNANHEYNTYYHIQDGQYLYCTLQRSLRTLH